MDIDRPGDDAVAVAELPRDLLFYKDLTVPQLAERRGLATSTIYNQKARAQSALRRDDVFFSALHALNRVRDEARVRDLAERCPNGKMPDGRRRVVIQNAA